MPITPEQFRVVYPQLAEWIRRTLDSHAAQTRSVATAKFTRLPQYYSSGLLLRAKYIPVADCPTPPLTKFGLVQFSEFEQMKAKGITYLDTYFVRTESVQDEALHFHELIHVVQWGLLGAERFVATYADGLEKFGYRNSPLEVMAFNAEARFRNGEKFNAEALVREQLR